MTKLNQFIIAAAVVAILCVIRALLTGEEAFFFIFTNVVLAAVPLMLECLFLRAKKLPTSILPAIVVLGLGAMWLLFLPNAFYLLTDFMHLNGSVVVNARDDMHGELLQYVRGDALYIFDTLLMFVATAFGAIAGGLALTHAFNFFRRHGGLILGVGATGAIMGLSAVGVYLGRYGRWNSWDALSQPWVILSDLAGSLSDPVTLNRFSLFVMTMIIFQVVSFGYVFVKEKR